MPTITGRISYGIATVIVDGTLIIEGTGVNAEAAAFNDLQPQFAQGACVDVTGEIVPWKNGQALDMQSAAPGNGC